MLNKRRVMRLFPETRDQVFQSSPASWCFYHHLTTKDSVREVFQDTVGCLRPFQFIVDEGGNDDVSTVLYVFRNFRA